MPPKHMQDFYPTLCIQYPDGHYEPLGKISDVNMEPSDYYDCFPSPYVNIREQSEMTISFRWDVSAKAEYLLIYGKMPTNNWMKMHGLPMERRRVRGNKYRRKSKNASAYGTVHN